jgi:aspartate kinase
VPGTAARLFEAIASADVNIDMIVQNVSATETGLTDISFTLPADRLGDALRAIEGDAAGIGYQEVVTDSTIGKISLVGAGMRTNAGVSARFFAALRDAGVNIEMISTSDIRISVVTRSESLDDAVRAVHTAFELDSTDGEAVVYGGSGR